MYGAEPAVLFRAATLLCLGPLNSHLTVSDAGNLLLTRQNKEHRRALYHSEVFWANMDHSVPSDQIYYNQVPTPFFFSQWSVSKEDRDRLATSRSPKEPWVT
jgi:hypothetical protein